MKHDRRRRALARIGRLVRLALIAGWPQIAPKANKIVEPIHSEGLDGGDGRVEFRVETALSTTVLQQEVKIVTTSHLTRIDLHHHAIGAADRRLGRRCRPGLEHRVAARVASILSR